MINYPSNITRQQFELIRLMIHDTNSSYMTILLKSVLDATKPANDCRLVSANLIT